MGKIQSIYAKLPVPLQHVAVSAYGAYWYWLRFGPGYKRNLSEYAKREQFDNSGWQSWQKNALEILLRDAATQVPFYVRAWNGDIKAAAILGRLEALPLLEKESIRAEPDSFLRQDIKAKRRLIL